MKRIISLLLVLALVGTVGFMPNKVRAEENVQEGVIVEEKVQYLNRSEAIKLVVEKEGLSYKEAEKLFPCEQKVFKDSLLRSSITYPTYTKIYKYPGGAKVEIGGVWELYCNGSFRQLNKLKAKWTKAAGTGGYTWNEAHITDITTRYPAVEVRLLGRGDIEIKVTRTQAASVGAQLEGMGFTVSSSTSKATIYRKTVDLQLIKSIY